MRSIIISSALALWAIPLYAPAQERADFLDPDSEAVWQMPGEHSLVYLYAPFGVWMDLEVEAAGDPIVAVYSPRGSLLARLETGKKTRYRAITLESGVYALGIAAAPKAEVHAAYRIERLSPAAFYLTQGVGVGSCWLEEGVRRLQMFGNGGQVVTVTGPDRLTYEQRLVDEVSSWDMTVSVPRAGVLDVRYTDPWLSGDARETSFEDLEPAASQALVSGACSESTRQRWASYGGR